MKTHKSVVSLALRVLMLEMWMSVLDPPSGKALWPLEKAWR